MIVMGVRDPRPNPPHELTGFLLRRAYVVSRASAEACIADDTDVREFPVMTLLAELGAMSQSKLGELMHRDRTTIGRLVDGLVAKEWLARERDPLDRRSNVLRLTEGGRQALGALRRALDHGESTLIRRLTDDERNRLAAELRELLGSDATLDVESLGNRCGYLIARAHRALFRRAIDALEPLGLTPRDLGILSALGASQPCSQQQLAATLGISPPAVLGFVDELEERGLVVRRRNVADRRAYDLTLTRSGDEKLVAARRLAADLQAEIRQRLGAPADRDLRQLLRKVIEEPPTSSAAPVDLAGS